MRTNFDFEITSTTKLKANLAGMHAVQSAPPGNAMEFIFTSIHNLSGDTPVMLYEDGMYGAYNANFKSPNPYYVLHYSGVEENMRSEEHTSELQSLMRISYAVFCLKKKKTHTYNHYDIYIYTNQQSKQHHKK